MEITKEKSNSEIAEKCFLRAAAGHRRIGSNRT
jgi:hypothetical protein